MYEDLTGNVRLDLSEPGLFIETTGAQENPEPSARDRKSSREPRPAGTVGALRLSASRRLRELAKRAGVDPGYASRVVDFLDREAVVTRTARGPITASIGAHS